MGIRKRVGRQRFSLFVAVLARIGCGTFAGYTDASLEGKDERWIVERGFGLDRAQKNRLAEALPWVTGDASQVFVELSARLREHAFGATLQETSDVELQRDRDDVHLFCAGFAGIGHTFDPFFSPGAFGFSLFAEFFASCGVQEQAMLVLFGRMGRSWGLGTNMDQVLSMV